MLTGIRRCESDPTRPDRQAVNQDQLAREMESDRVAASRAMAQNKQLKRQLEELQDGFITLVGRAATHDNQKRVLNWSMSIE